MKAFLSHSSFDKPIVNEIAERLGTANVELDSDTFERGLLTFEAIEKSLHNASLFVLFLSKAAIASNVVKFETLLAREMEAKGLIEKILVVCLDNEAFASAPEEWKAYNFVRKAVSPQSIARLIQNELIVSRAKLSANTQPFMGRSRELNDAKEKIVDPAAGIVRALYVSGNSGIGRRTFIKHLLRDVYPSVNAVLPEIRVEKLDGYDEIYRKLNEQFTPIATLSTWRARIMGFAVADENGKALLLAQLLDKLPESREALIINDDGGLLDNDGSLQLPLRNAIGRIKNPRHPTIIFVAQRMIPRQLRFELDGVVFVPLPSLAPNDVRQLLSLLLKNNDIQCAPDEMQRLVELSDGHPFNVNFLVESAKEYGIAAVLADTSEFAQWKHRRASEFIQNFSFSDEERKLLGVMQNFNALDFETISRVSEADVHVVGRALVRLIDLHILEVSGQTYVISPPL